MPGMRMSRNTTSGRRASASFDRRFAVAGDGQHLELGPERAAVRRAGSGRAAARPRRSGHVAFMSGSRRCSRRASAAAGGSSPACRRRRARRRSRTMARVAVERSPGARARGPGRSGRVSERGVASKPGAAVADCAAPAGRHRGPRCTSMRPPATCGSRPCLMLFSTSGCSSSGGTGARGEFAAAGRSV